MTRQEHMQWCKDRALEYLKPGKFYSVTDAVASMLSDLRKHPETASLLPIAVGMSLMVRDEAAARRFIEGFAA